MNILYRSQQTTPTRLPLILVADDNELNRETLVDFLNFSDFRAIEATDGLTAIERIEQQLLDERAEDGGDEQLTGALATPRLSDDIEVPLTRRESEVLRQLAHGLTNKEIAQALGISYETVKEHVQHILRKVGVTDRTQAAVWAVRKGLV